MTRALGPITSLESPRQPIEIRGLIDRLDDGAAVLDVGCGAGVPIAKSLAERHRVTGVDVSPEMVRLARRQVPSGDFRCADVMSTTFEPSSFDAVVALYSIFHISSESGRRRCFGGFTVGSGRADFCCAR